MSGHPVSGGAYRRFDVGVDGGRLAAASWGADDSATTVVALHGITANHLCFALLAEALPGLRVVAPDLRGRGASAALPGQWGMDRHAADVAALIDAVGGPVVLVGHSMGGFVAAAVVRRLPDPVRGLVLVDGGLPLQVPPGLDAAQATALVLGPALQRLGMRFPSREAYQAFWRQHPALSADWNGAVEAYVDYDLTGRPPDLRSSVSADAVAQDSADLYVRVDEDAVLGTFSGPARLLVVSKGLLGQPPGLYPDEELARWRPRLPNLIMERVPDLNHYTILLRPDGAGRVAAAVRAVS